MLRLNLCFLLYLRNNSTVIYETNTVKDLGIQIDKRLTWKQLINHVAYKLIKSYPVKIKTYIGYKIYAMLHSFGRKTLI